MKPRVCRECAPSRTPRPAPHPGPRCVTHHRAIVKARKAKAHELRVQAVYGLPAGGYERLYHAQGGRCWICRRARGLRKRLPVDHDHVTGQVRGLLCNPCNQMLGHLRDDPDAFLRAAEYLLNPPAQRLLTGDT